MKTKDEMWNAITAIVSSHIDMHRGITDKIDNNLYTAVDEELTRLYETEYMYNSVSK